VVAKQSTSELNSSGGVARAKKSKVTKSGDKSLEEWGMVMQVVGSPDK
jgi:hypothetical protein